MNRSDAVIIGAGHNGLAAAIVLASAGWEVTVIERNEYAGGAIRTAEATLPGFRHDLYAANLNLFVGSPFFAEYGERLARHGFDAVVASRPFGSVFPDGTALGVSTDADETTSALRALSRADADSWVALGSWFDEVAPILFGLLAAPMPSRAAARTLWKQRRALRRHWPELARLALQSPREFVVEHFEHPKTQALCATWGMHLDFPPDAAGGAPFAMLETFAGAARGMAIGRGGADVVVTALEGVLRELGGRILLGREVDGIEIRGGRAVAVTVDDGSRYEASRAVLANLTPQALFSRLIGPDALDPVFRQRASRYRYGPGTMMIHLAVDGPIPWRDASVAGHMYVHAAPFLDDLSLAYAQAISGLLPARPMIVVGQPTVIDPSRAPAGKHVLWIQVRAVPGQIRGDSLGEITGRQWDEIKEDYALRVIDLLEEYAPGIGRLVIGRHVISPDDLERANPNLVGGDHLGGSHHLAQHFLLRPVPGYSRYALPIDRLYMCGAGTWPGAGLGAGSGYMLGKMLVKSSRIAQARRRLSERSRPASAGEHGRS